MEKDTEIEQFLLERRGTIHIDEEDEELEELENWERD
jgi:hypothetical protein